MTMQAVIYFKSGRVVELDVPEAWDDPEKLTDKVAKAIPVVEFLQVGTHLVFLKEIEQIEFRLRPREPEPDVVFLPEPEEWIERLMSVARASKYTEEQKTLIGNSLFNLQRDIIRTKTPPQQ